MSIFNFSRTWSLVALTFMAPLIWDSPSSASDRVALVIGISNYENVSPLKNGTSDARMIAAILTNNYFEVIEATDVKARELRALLRRFRHSASKATTAIVYFAGHGIEVRGSNYLIAKDSDIDDLSNPQRDLISLDEVEAATLDVAGLRMIVLDACRDDPLSSGAGNTAAPLQSHSGTAVQRLGISDFAIIYSAMHGQTAQDGNGPNSPFALAFAEALTADRNDYHSFAGAIRDKVIFLTKGKQQPFIYSSIGSTRYELGRGPSLNFSHL